MMKFLVTGAAGFIGYHLSARLLRDGHDVVGLDGFTPYYDPKLKRARFDQLLALPSFSGVELMLEEGEALKQFVARETPDVVIHLAAQAGVRYSLEAPGSYVSANILGTFNLLEAIRATPPKHLLLASTSSVYGANKPPFRETDRADHPLSIYAATKKATEDLAHSYANLFKQPITALRFFTVYGTWYRPDMALYKFTRAILSGHQIDLYNEGRMRRDFTHVDEVTEAIVRLFDRIPSPGGDVGSSTIAPYRVVNIAGGRPVPLMDYVAAIEAAAGCKASLHLMPMQPGDMEATEASTDLLNSLIGHVPPTNLQTGVAEFVAWYRSWHKL